MTPNSALQRTRGSVFGGRLMLSRAQVIARAAEGER